MEPIDDDDDDDDDHQQSQDGDEEEEEEELQQHQQQLQQHPIDINGEDVDEQMDPDVAMHDVYEETFDPDDENLDDDGDIAANLLVSTSNRIY